MYIKQDILLSNFLYVSEKDYINPENGRCTCTTRGFIIEGAFDNTLYIYNRYINDDIVILVRPNLKK